ncbi:hypothetical protein FACS1894125_4080 [Actinomycetota bacterium]|nr:hypothetical protein FACS1894125_4080 [Actinomycetota bacterium]
METIKALVVVHFDSVKADGGFWAEFSQFYTNYSLVKARQVKIAGLDSPLYIDCQSRAFVITNMGKTNTACALSALFSNPELDFSSALIITAGCAGGNKAFTTLGDVVISRATVDPEAVHHFSSRDVKPREPVFEQFHDFDHFNHCILNPKLVSSALDVAQSVVLVADDADGLTSKTKAQYGQTRAPQVMGGITVTSDNYWHGATYSARVNAVVQAIGKHIGQEWDGYTVSECEDNSVALVAKKFGHLDRVLSVRAVTNYTEPPNQSISPLETVDRPSGAFDLGMVNLFRVVDKIITALN